MKKISVSLLFMLCSAGLFALDSLTFKYSINEWLTAGPIELQLPAFNNRPDLNDNTFKSEHFLDAYILPEHIRIAAGNYFLNAKDKKYQWSSISTDSDGNVLVSKSNKEVPELHLLATYLEINRFSKLCFEVETDYPFALYIDHKKIGGSNNGPAGDKHEPVKINTKLEPGKYSILIKILSPPGENNIKTLASVTGADKYSQLEFSLSPKLKKNMRHVLEGVRVSGLNVSPDGKYIMLSFSETFPPEGKTARWYELRDTQTNDIIQSFKHASIRNVKFHPKRNSISYVSKMNDKEDLVLFDLNKRTEITLMSNLENFSNYHWSPDGSQIVFSKSQKEEPGAIKKGVKRLEGMHDRWPEWRTRSQLYALDVESGISRPLTHGFVSSTFVAFSPDGSKILFFQTVPDYSERLYNHNSLIELDLRTHLLDTILETNLNFSAAYSPDGKELLITGGPTLFGEKGNVTPEELIPNESDTQGYIMELSDRSVTAITRDFDPKLLRFNWNDHDGKIYLLTEEGTYQSLYTYDPSSSTFTKLPAEMDMVNGFSLAKNAPVLAYYGNSISAPEKALILNTGTLEQKTISDPEKEVFEDVVFGTTEDWNITVSNGNTVYGQIYYPPHFDPEHQYPCIVYYYGGINPINRAFRGRYPKNYFAAIGYVVYAMTPSGSTGFGQEYAALHVNNWGMTVADEIIESTQKFIESHDFIDESAVGCIGASYGGFMTMLLLTKTDIFSAAISHAGISSIASYWGEGYWGYLYSAIATANSFPWNRRDIYVEQSPLFHADKVNTPLLLLHGGRDTNVPTGESIKMYTALKLLGKPVEYVEVEDQDHHILDYKKRLEWQKTIMSWFDKWLKDQPEWWNELYPDRNL